MSRFLVLGAMPFLLCCLFTSCSNKQTNETITAELKSGIEESNKIIATSNEGIIQSLQIKKEDIKLRDKANVWLPKADSIASIAQKQVAYLEKLKMLLTDSSGNEESVQDLLSSENSAKKLYDRLSTYWQTMLSVDVRMQETLGEEIKKMNQSLMRPKNHEQFWQQYFLSVNRTEAVSLLSKFQNDILRTENKCLLFCHGQLIYHGHDIFNSFEAILGQSAKILEAGDELEITSGIGSFSRTRLPKITIEGKIIDLNDRGLAVYKFKTSKKLGNYSLPVTVAFIDEDGKSQERTFTVEYTLVEAIKKK